MPAKRILCCCRLLSSIVIVSPSATPTTRPVSVSLTAGSAQRRSQTSSPRRLVPLNRTIVFFLPSSRRSQITGKHFHPASYQLGLLVVEFSCSSQFKQVRPWDLPDSIR